MEKGISLYFGKIENKNDFKYRLDLIKKYGFDTIMTSIGFNEENGKLSHQVKYCKKIGLKLSSLHSKYVSKNLHFLWEDCKEGENICKDLIKQLKICHKFKFKCLVIHTDGIPCEIGLNRFKKILKIANKLNTPIAIENIGNKEIMDYLFSHLGEDKMLRVCYDSGHEHAFNGQHDFLENYYNKIICLHLHDNIGGEKTEVNKRNIDMHNFIGSGNIDFNEKAKYLSKIPVSLDLELLLNYDNNYSYDEILSKGIEGLNNLENMINNYINLN